MDVNIYRIIFLILIILFILEDYLKKSKKIYKFFKVISIIILILLVGCRGIIARDDKMYFDIFEYVPKIYELSFHYLELERVEMGYTILNSMVKTFTENYKIIFFIVALISFINLYIFINYFSNYFFYSIAFYYCRWLFLKEFTQVRSALACSFFYIGLIFLYKKKYLYYFFCILLGGVFHKAILFCLIFPLFIYFYQKKYINKIVYILIIFLPFINTKIILNNILLKMKLIDPVYLIGEYSKRQSYIGIYYSLFSLMILYFFNKKLKKIEKYNFLKRIYIFSIFISSSLFYYGDITGRLSSFFNVEFLLHDKVLKIFKNKILIKIIMVIFLILMYKINFTNRLEYEYWNYF
mgnify:CR=1 FL=1